MKGTKMKEEELIKHQAEAWCHMVAELMIDFGLDSSEPGKVALEQVQNFLRRLKSSKEFYERRCNELQRVQSQMRDPERKMVCDILANGTTHVKPMELPAVEVVLRQDLFDRWILVNAHDHKIAWSGSRWVTIDGYVQIANFPTRDLAKEFAEQFGFKVMPPPPHSPPEEKSARFG